MAGIHGLVRFRGLMTRGRHSNDARPVALGIALVAALTVESLLADAVDEKRLDPEIFQVESQVGSETLEVSYNLIQGLCGDGDGCSLRMILSGSGGGFDSRTFVIGDSGGWSADVPGGGKFTSGNADTVGDETVFGTGSDSLCRFQDATSFNGILKVRRFELVVEGPTILPGSATCVLRVDD